MNDPLLEELITREDIIVTPHIAFYTEAAIQHLIFDALDATMEVLNTGTTQLEIKKHKGSEKHSLYAFTLEII